MSSYRQGGGNERYSPNTGPKEPHRDIDLNLRWAIATLKAYEKDHDMSHIQVKYWDSRLENGENIVHNPIMVSFHWEQAGVYYGNTFGFSQDHESFKRDLRAFLGIRW